MGQQALFSFLEMDLVFEQARQLSGGIFDLYEIVHGMLFALVAIVLATLTSSKPGKDIEKEFELVEKALA